MKKFILLCSSLLLTSTLSMPVSAQDVGATDNMAPPSDSGMPTPDNSSPPTPANSADSNGPEQPSASVMQNLSPCKNIKDACEAAGYTKENMEGKALWPNCVKPTLLGQQVSGVTVNPADVTACRAKVAERKAKKAEKSAKEAEQMMAPLTTPTPAAAPSAPTPQQ